MKNQNLLSSILLILVCGVVVFLLYRTTSKDNNIISNQRKEIQKLKRTIAIQDSIKSAEATLRKKEYEKRGNIYKDLKEKKRKDSLTYVRTIKQLMTIYKPQTLEESTKQLLEEYEKAMLDTATHN